MKRLYKILIVDDERSIRKSLERNITRKFQNDGVSIDIRQAENGEQCIALAKEDRPDLILLDIRMPLMDGYQACALLRSNPLFDPTVILILTAEATAEVKCLSNGADDYITKPFDMSALLLRVENGLRTSERRSENLKDPETGLWGRGHFENAQIIGELCRAKRYKRDLSLLLTEFDVPSGVIEEKGDIAAILTELTDFFVGRSSDISARWGNKTFAILLPETGQAGAMIFAERVINNITAYDARLHTSIGISVLDSNNNIEAITAFAETSLAVAKDRDVISINGRVAQPAVE